MNQSTNHGLFLVDSFNIPLLDSQAIADQIVARIESEYAHTNPHFAHITHLPVSLFEPRRDTPVTVLRRVIRSVVPSLLAFAPLIFRP
jgi:hypothetical protein